MKKILLPLLFGLAQLSSQAQASTDTIDAKNVNFTLIEKLFMEKLNHYRLSLALCQLTCDHVLQLAAQDQALYEQKLKKLTHYQENSGKKYTPMKRIAYYKGQCEMAGENALSTRIGIPVFNSNTHKTTTVTTYEQAAESLLEAWKTSPEHHKVMVNPYYKNTGIGFAYNTKTKALYAVQVFANRVSKS